MSIWRAQIILGADGPLPKDRMILTPHFKHTGPTIDVDGLCQDLVNGISTLTGNFREVRVKMYDAEAAKPVFPSADKQKNTGLFPAGTTPRELCLCLSYYADTNRPRRRGRLYLPMFMVGGAAGLRPTTTQQTTAGGIVPVLSGLGGIDVDWVVWSRRDNAAHTVTNWYVNDEWDIQRRRGLRETARITGSTSG
jgi:hypothetical protein